MDESKHEIHSQVDAITAGTASMVNLTAGDDSQTLHRQQPFVLGSRSHKFLPQVTPRRLITRLWAVPSPPSPPT